MMDAAGLAAEPQAAQRRVTGKRLALKVFAVAFPSVVLVVLLTQLALGYIHYRDRLDTLTGRARLIATLTAEAVARPLWTFDSQVYESQVRAIAADPAFLFAEIRDERGNAVFQFGLRPGPDTDFIDAAAAVRDPTSGEPMGQIRLMLSSTELAASARRQITIGLAAFAVLLVAVLSTVHLALAGLVVRPLNRLLAAMGQVERKHWTTIGDESRRSDEIGRVIDAFNRMVDGLRSGDEAKRLLQALETAQAELLDKNSALERANALIVESIQYARKIQDGLLPAPGALAGSVAELELVWEPLQVVGGDYAWLQQLDGKSLIFIADCTGHGVPGAFMTMVVAAALDHIVRNYDGEPPSVLLERLDQAVRARLRQDQPDSASDDGLDAAICLFDPALSIVTYAGANIPLLFTDGELVSEFRPARASLGYRTIPPRRPFVDMVIPVMPGRSFFLFTDGVPDHMGGQPPRLFGRRRLAAAISRAQGQSLAGQLRAIRDALDAYRGDQPRRDDMTMIAFRPL